MTITEQMCDPWEVAAKHVWVRPEWTRNVYPGLVLAWNRHPTRGWEALVVYATDDDTYLTDWRLPSELQPVAEQPPAGRF